MKPMAWRGGRAGAPVRLYKAAVNSNGVAAGARYQSAPPSPPATSEYSQWSVHGAGGERDLDRIVYGEYEAGGVRGVEVSWGNWYQSTKSMWAAKGAAGRQPQRWSGRDCSWCHQKQSGASSCQSDLEQCRRSRQRPHNLNIMV